MYQSEKQIVFHRFDEKEGKDEEPCCQQWTQWGDCDNHWFPAVYTLLYKSDKSYGVFGGNHPIT